MVKRNNYSKEYKNKLSAEICSGASYAVISKRENVSSQTLKRWNEEYLSGNFEENFDKSELIALRKKVADLSILYAEATLQNDILKKTEKFLIAKQRQDILSKPISPQNLEYRKALRRSR